MIENNFFYWKKLVRCLPTFSTENRKKIQLAGLSGLFQILQHGHVFKPRNPEQIFYLHNRECGMPVLNRNTSVFLALSFGEILPFEVRKVHKFPNIIYISTEEQNTNIILNVWNQNNKIWEIFYKYPESRVFTMRKTEIFHLHTYIKIIFRYSASPPVTTVSVYHVTFVCVIEAMEVLSKS